MFRTSTPVVGSAFHNRKAELAALTRAMKGLVAGKPQWVAILGPRKIGKTSLVLEAARLTRSEQLKVITLDIQDQGPVSPKFFRRLALAVFDAALGDELGESLERLATRPPEYRALLQQSKRFLKLPPALRSEALELVEGEVSPERVNLWLDFPEQLAKSLDLYFIIALDEFQELGELHKTFNSFSFMQLRSHWQKHQRSAYFISGSARSMLLQLIQAPHAPFFQHFAIHELGSFTPEAAVALLQEESIPENPVPREIAELAVKTLGGHPFYLQLLGEELVGNGQTPDQSSLKAALQRLLFSKTGRLALYFEGAYQKLVGRSTSLAATLDALSDGPVTLTSVSKAIQASSSSTVSYLSRLHDAAVQLDSGLYALSDPVFGLWLKWRRPGGTVLPMTLIGDEAEQAVARALSSMGFELVYQSKGSRGAFDLLALRGSMQLGVQVKRSELPLRFDKREWSRMVADGKRFKWSWVVAAVTPEGTVTILDPAKASIKKGVSLPGTASIDNLLQWLDAQ